MSNLKTLKQNINLLEYIQNTLKSVESIQINQKTVLHKHKIIHQSLSNKFQYLQNIINISISKKKLLIIMGSDTSLCGSYNNSLIKYSIKNTEKFKNYNEIIIVGKKLKKIILDHNNVDYWLLKDFQNHNYKSWLSIYGYNIDFLGYNTKDISIMNITTAINNDNNKDNDNMIIEINDVESINLLFFQWMIKKCLYNIQNQENIQRLMFLKSALDNCQEEIENNIKKYRSKRQENITREINELIGANLDN